MARRIQLRRDTAANWTNTDPVLAQGEVGVDLTSMQIKVGNGVDSWTELDYLASNGEVDLTGYATEDYVDQAIAAIPPGNGEVDLTGYATEDYVDQAIGAIEFPGVEIDHIELTARTQATAPIISFEKPPNTELVDEIDDGLALTRPVGVGAGLINIAVESTWDTETSPANTLWNWDGWDNLDTVKTRNYANLRQTLKHRIGENIRNAELVMYDITNDKYYKIKVTEWAQGPAHTGAFTYTRQLIDTSYKVGIEFADGTSLVTRPKDFVDLPQIFSGDTNEYILGLGDRGKHIYAFTESIIKIPTEAQVNFPIGSTFIIVTGEITGNNGIRVSCTAPMTIEREGTAGQTTWQLKPYSTLMLVKIAANKWNLSGAVDLSDYALASSIPDVSEFITASDIPSIPTDISELTDTEGLLGQGGSADTGDITFDGAVISAPDLTTIVVEARDEDGVVTASLTLDPDESIAKLESSIADNTSFSTNNGYGTAEWTVDQFGNAVLIFSDARILYEFIESSNTSWNRGNNRTFSWNGGDQSVEYTGFSWNDGINELTLAAGSGNLPPEDPTEVTLLTFNWTNTSRIGVDSYDNEAVEILGRGIPVRINTTDRLNVDADDIRLYSQANDESYIRLYAGDYVRIRTNSYDGSPGSNQWQFNNDGSLTLPNDGEIAFYRSGTEEGRIIPSTSTGGGLQVEAKSDFEIKVTQGTGEEEETAIWSFEPNGVLTLPAGGNIKDSEGNSVLGQGNGSTADLGNFVFTDSDMSVAVEELFSQSGELSARPEGGNAWDFFILYDLESPIETALGDYGRYSDDGYWQITVNDIEYKNGVEVYTDTYGGVEYFIVYIGEETEVNYTAGDSFVLSRFAVSDLRIKAPEDLYLDALGDDVIVRASDDIRLRPGYNFEDGEYTWQFRFTDGGEQIFYNGNDEENYGRITPNLFDEGVRGLTLEGENQLRLSVASGSELILNSDGGLIFPDGDIQTTAYAGTNGRLMFIDTNRSGDYTENGSADKPFKTFTAAIAAAEDSDDTAYTFLLMGCTVTEDVDFTGTTFTQITISTACRSVISGNISIASIPTLSQLVIRNIEVGGTFTLTGDGTANQMNNCSFYNTSFTGAVNITATNATAFYEAAFFGAVNFTNLSYLYINGAQFNADWTITADSDGVIPSRGINPGTGGSIAVVFSTIANNVIFVKGGTAAYVFQPHMTRLGRTTETYTIPSGWTVASYSTVFRGNWVNNGSLGLRNSSTDNRVKGTAAAVAGIIGGDRVIAKLAPATSKGIEGDRQGMIAADSTYYYVCTADWTDGVADIWSRNPLASGTW